MTARDIRSRTEPPLQIIATDLAKERIERVLRDAARRSRKGFGLADEEPWIAHDWKDSRPFRVGPRHPIMFLDISQVSL